MHQRLSRCFASIFQAPAAASVWTDLSTSIELHPAGKVTGEKGPRLRLLRETVGAVSRFGGSGQRPCHRRAALAPIRDLLPRGPRAECSRKHRAADIILCQLEIERQRRLLFGRFERNPNGKIPIRGSGVAPFSSSADRQGQPVSLFHLLNQGSSGQSGCSGLTVPS